MSDAAIPRACVMGWPVAHSLSPALHGFWLKRYGISGEYTARAVAPKDLAAGLAALRRDGWRGCNLTTPHKEAALALMDERDEAAKAIGAVNTVAVEKGRLLGSNTDGFGFIENLRETGFDPRSGLTAVLGAGGAARAIVWALLRAGAPEICLLNRTPGRAEALAKTMGAKVRTLSWDGRNAAFGGIVLLVNATSLGMAGNPPLALSLDALPKDAAVADIVYAPLETPLLAAARARGNRVVDGLGMLLHQARPGFRAWFGVMPEVTAELRRAVLAAQA